MGIKPSKKLILIITLVLVLIVLGVLIYFFLFRPIIKLTEEVVPQQGKIIEKQLEVLQALPQPLSEEEIEKQMKELEQNQAIPPLSEEEINKQLEELNK